MFVKKMLLAVSVCGTVAFFGMPSASHATSAVCAACEANYQSCAAAARTPADRQACRADHTECVQDNLCYGGSHASVITKKTAPLINEGKHAPALLASK